jgi:hypothetical protein
VRRGLASVRRLEQVLRPRQRRRTLHPNSGAGRLAGRTCRLRAKKGRVILKRDRGDFDRQIERFKQIVTKYQEALKLSVDTAREGFCDQLVKEFAERWTASPPGFLRRRSGANSPDRIKNEIISRADELFSKIVDFAPPEVILNYKAIVIEDIEDSEFRATLRAAMEKARVDKATLDRLFETGEAAAAQGAFKEN